jgi:hypothetical protein
MLTGAQMTRMPDDISRGRADFKVYMDQLLQHSNSTWAREAPGEAGTAVGGVQLPPAGVMHEEERAPLTTAWDVQSSKDNSANTFSESELVAQVRLLSVERIISSTMYASISVSGISAQQAITRTTYDQRMPEHYVSNLHFSS